MSWTFTRKRKNIIEVDVPRLSLAKLRRKQFKTTVPTIVGEYTKALMTNPIVGRLTARNRRHDVKINRKKHIGARIYPTLAFEGDTKSSKLLPSYPDRRRTLNAIKKFSTSRLYEEKKTTGKSPRIHSPSLSPVSSFSRPRKKRLSKTFSRPVSQRRSRRNSRYSYSPASSRPHSRQYSPGSANRYSYSRPPTSRKRRKRRRKKKKETYTRIPEKSNVLVIKTQEVEKKNIENDFKKKMRKRMIPERPSELVPRTRKPMSRILSRKPLERLPFTEQSPFIIRDNVIQQLKNTIDSPNLWARGLLTNHLESGFYQPLMIKEDFSRNNKNDGNETTLIESSDGKVDGKLPKRKYDLSFGSSIHTNLKRPKTVPARLVGDQKRLNFRKRRRWRDDDSTASETTASDSSFPFFHTSHHELFKDEVKVKKVLSPEEKRQRGMKNRFDRNDLAIDVSQTLSDRDLELEISRIFAGNVALKGRDSNSSSPLSTPMKNRPSTVPYGRKKRSNHTDPNYYLEKLKKEFDLMDV